MSFQMKALYRTMALTTLALMIPTGGARAQLPEKKLADRIVVAKSARTMTLEINGHVLRTYRVALGGQPVGAKERQGDHKTPEGDYIIDAKNAHSQFYMELHISYPNAVDRARARNLGVSPGGDVEIHGLGKQYGWIGARHRLVDWTDGCIAVTNEEIQEIFGMVGHS